MKRKRVVENYLMRVDEYVYDYKYEDSMEKIVIARVENVDCYSIYIVHNNKPTLAFTNMSEAMIAEYQEDFARNLVTILNTGRSGLQ